VRLAFLTSYRNRLGAVLTWATAFIRDSRHECAYTTQQIDQLRDVYEVPPGTDRPAVGRSPLDLPANLPDRPAGGQ
jgi:hypothetical protein